MRSPAALCLVTVALFQATVADSVPAADSKRLGVTGVGHLEVKPDVMELAATVTGSAELTKDALKKFRDNKRRGIDAIKKLKLEGVKIKESGISVISNAAMQQYQQNFGGAQQQTAAGHTTFSETITVEVPGIDRLADEKVEEMATKIMDAGKDAGLTMGQSFDPYRRYYDYSTYKPQIVFFRVDKGDEAKQKALDLAAADARKKAEQMAKRLQISLGKTLSARDSSSPQVNYPQAYNQNAQHTTTQSAAALHPVPIDAVLFVEFEILD